MIEARLHCHDRHDQQRIEAELLGVGFGSGERGLDGILRHTVGVGDPVADARHLGRQLALVLGKGICTQGLYALHYRLGQLQRGRGCRLGCRRQGDRRRVKLLDVHHRQAHRRRHPQAQARRHRQLGNRRLDRSLDEGVAELHPSRTFACICHIRHAHEAGRDCHAVRDSERDTAHLTRKRLDSSCVLHGVLHAVA